MWSVAAEGLEGGGSTDGAVFGRDGGGCIGMAHGGDFQLAAETQFEGNRFFDLMRISRHRGGTEYFADCVSRRFANPAAIRARLLDRENWWVK